MWTTAENNEWMRLCDQTNWFELCGLVSWVYSMSNGRPSKEVRTMLWLEMYKHANKNKISDKDLVEQIKTDNILRYFCGIEDMYEEVSIDSSSMTKFRNRISEHEKSEEIMKKIQEAHFVVYVKKLAKKTRKQYDQDGTVINEKIKSPHDVELLNDVVERWSELIKRWRRFFWERLWLLVAKWKEVGKKLYYSYQFWKQKRDEIRDKVKWWLISVGKWIWKTVEKIKEEVDRMVVEAKKSWVMLQKWVIKFQKALEHHIKIWEKILEQQGTMLKEGSKKVADRIVSYSREHIRPIVKWKVGRFTQFWAKAQVGVIWWKVAVAVWFSRDNENESKTIKKWVETYRWALWRNPSEVWYDKWWRWQETYEYLKEEKIKNHIQWSPNWWTLSKTTKKRLYNRRSRCEQIINDVLNYRWVNNNQYAKKNLSWSLLMGCMASNMVRLG